MGTIPERGGRESPSVVGCDGCLVHGLERHRLVVRGLCPALSGLCLLLSLSCLFFVCHSETDFASFFYFIIILFVFFGHIVVLLTYYEPSSACWDLLLALAQPDTGWMISPPGLISRFGILAPKLWMTTLALLLVFVPMVARTIHWVSVLPRRRLLCHTNIVIS